MRIEIAGTLELADIRHSCRWMWQLQEDEIRAANPGGLALWLFGPFFVVVAVVLGAGGMIFLALASGLIGLLLLFPSLTRLPWRLHYLYSILPGQYREYQKLFEVRWRIDDLGLDVIDARPSEQRYNWTDYRDAVEDETGFLLYWWPEPGVDPATLGDREQIVHYLPRRFFSPEHATEFGAFLQARFASPGEQA
jgi:hypothetical protein